MSSPHPEDYCHKCGGPNIAWFAPNAIWNAAVRKVNEPEILCPVCFVRLAEDIGINVIWEIAPKNYHTGEGANTIIRSFQIADSASPKNEN